MTNELPMTNAKAGVQAPAVDSSFGFYHSSATGASSLVTRLLTLAIRAYQLAISPALTVLFGPAGGCRFTPTCSQYTIDAVREHGALAGGALAARRICRCHPWGDCGHDPVPKSGKRKAASGEFGEPASL